MDAPSIFIKWSEYKGKTWAGLTKQQTCKINTIAGWFNAAATEEETSLLRNGGEDGERRRVAERINHVVRKRLALEFKERTGEVPPALRAGKILKFTTLISKLEGLSKLKSNAVDLTLDDADLPAFRAEVDHRRPPSPPPSPLPSPPPSPRHHHHTSAQEDKAVTVGPATTPATGSSGANKHKRMRDEGEPSPSTSFFGSLFRSQ